MKCVEKIKMLVVVDGQRYVEEVEESPANKRASSLRAEGNRAQEAGALTQGTVTGREQG